MLTSKKFTDPAQQQSTASAVVQHNPYPIPIAREADGFVTPYLSNAELYAILDSEDIAQY